MSRIVNMHMQDIRLYRNEGIKIPVCHAGASVLDLYKSSLPMTMDYSKVTCKRCLRMAPKEYPWAGFGEPDSS